VKIVFNIAHSQIQELGKEVDRLTRQAGILQKENTNLKARDRHSAVVAGGGKRLQELEGSVEELQMANAVS
jgi:hypothetical protein